MARPRSTDPKTPVTIRLRRSTLARLSRQAEQSQTTVGRMLGQMVEAAIGAPTSPSSRARKPSAQGSRTPKPSGERRQRPIVKPPPEPRRSAPSAARCDHPVSRRIGNQCAVCGSEAP